MNETVAIIEDQKANVVGISGASGDTRFDQPISRKDWEKNPHEAAQARGVSLPVQSDSE